MDSIIKNIQFDQRLILIACILVAYPIFYSTSDIVGTGVLAANEIVRLSNNWRGNLFDEFDEDTKQQFAEYERGLHSEDAPLTQESQRLLVGEMQVDQFLKIRSKITPREIELNDISITEDDPFKPDIDLLRSLLFQIQELYQESLLPQNTTFDQLSNDVQERVTVPIIGQKVYVEDAILIISIALIVVFLHLISLVKALLAVLMRRMDISSFEFIWIHPGILGVGIGIMWLMLPSVIIGLSIVRDIISIYMGICIVALLSTLGIIAIFNLLAVRKKVLCNLANGCNKESGDG